VTLRSAESRELSPSAVITLPPLEALSRLGSAPEGLLEIDAAARRGRWPKPAPGQPQVGLVRHPLPEDTQQTFDDLPFGTTWNRARSLD
jgi:hypothetical protein